MSDPSPSYNQGSGIEKRIQSIQVLLGIAGHSDPCLMLVAHLKKALIETWREPKAEGIRV